VVRADGYKSAALGRPPLKPTHPTLYQSTTHNCALSLSPSRTVCSPPRSLSTPVEPNVETPKPSFFWTFHHSLEHTFGMQSPPIQSFVSGCPRRVPVKTWQRLRPFPWNALIVRKRYASVAVLLLVSPPRPRCSRPAVSREGGRKRGWEKVRARRKNVRMRTGVMVKSCVLHQVLPWSTRTLPATAQHGDLFCGETLSPCTLSGRP